MDLANSNILMVIIFRGVAHIYTQARRNLHPMDNNKSIFIDIVSRNNNTKRKSETV